MSVFGTGVFAAAEIIRAGFSGEEARVSLWLPSRPFLQSVSFEVEAGNVGVVSATLAMPLMDGLALLQDDSLFIMGNVLKVKMGYSADGGASTPWLAGIMRVPQVQIDGSGVTITLVADAAVGVATSRASSGTYEGTTRSILEGIAKTYGWTLRIKPGGPPLDGNEVETFSPSVSTAWTVFRDLARKRGYEVTTLTKYEAGQSVNEVFLTPFVQAGDVAVRTFAMYGTPSAQDRIYPIVGFSSEATPLFAPTTRAGFTHSYMNERGEILDIRVGADTSESKAEDGKPVPASRNEDLSAEGQVVDLRSDPQAADHAVPNNIPVASGQDATIEGQVQATYDARAERDGYTVEVDTIGIPDIAFDDNHRIVGLGIFDGYHRVIKYRHEVDSGGFKSSWTGIRKVAPVAQSGLNVQAGSTPSNAQTGVE